ncbi:MAG: LysR substrate-binding domain-containing protein [Methyloligellaceae bacterium]
MPSHEEAEALPPLEWLRVFEAAGRLSNFTAAANELGLTQAAVSQRMRNLETHLDTHLFLRHARGVELTADGEAYLPHVRSAFNAIRRGTADLFGSMRTKITVAAPASVAALWIAPRLKEMRFAIPALQISISAIHRTTDFDAAQADLEVRFGRGSWKEREAAQLYQEQLVPTCSADLLAQAPDGDWRQLPIIAVSGPRDGWHEWSASTGELPLSQPVLRFDSLFAAQHAALSDAGVFLASLALARTAIQAGDLVTLSERPLIMNGSYWLTWPSRRLLSPVEETVISMLIND